ncbi:MAG: galactose-1-epimerase, partial [Ruminococcus sp.]|nr:galactose-1-epimerase [Ruminococcus sp.]
PDASGNKVDVVLGYDDCNGYRTANGACLGATVGRNANRLKGQI